MDPNHPTSSSSSSLLFLLLLFLFLLLHSLFLCFSSFIYFLWKNWEKSHCNYFFLKMFKLRKEKRYLTTYIATEVECLSNGRLTSMYLHQHSSGYFVLLGRQFKPLGFFSPRLSDIDDVPSLDSCGCLDASFPHDNVVLFLIFHYKL